MRFYSLLCQIPSTTLCLSELNYYNPVFFFNQNKVQSFDNLCAIAFRFHSLIAEKKSENVKFWNIYLVFENLSWEEKRKREDF